MATAKQQELLERKARLRQGGGEKAIEKQHASGKQTARERLTKLFDEGSFVETGLFVKHRCTNFGMDKKEAPGEGVVTGYGTVDGRPGRDYGKGNDSQPQAEGDLPLRGGV